MTISSEELSQKIVKLIDEHLAGAADKAGFSKLDVWVAAEDLAGNLDRDALANIICDYVGGSEMKRVGQWEVVSYLVCKLGLTSTKLAAQIEAKLDVIGTIPWEPFDEYSAWLALHQSGGVFAPSHLQKSSQSLRKMQPVKWLALSLVAFHGNPDGLTDTIRKMVSEGLLKPSDIETRYRALNHALAGAPLATFLQAMVNAAPTEAFASDLCQWAQTRLGIALSMPMSHRAIPAPDQTDLIFSRIRKMNIPEQSFQMAA